MPKLGWFLVFLSFSFPCFSENIDKAAAAKAGKESRPKLGILDVISKSYPESDTSLFTDVLRTEVFKLRLSSPRSRRPKS